MLPNYYPDTHNDRITTSVTPEGENWLLTVNIDGHFMHEELFDEWIDAQRAAESYETASYQGD